MNQETCTDPRPPLRKRSISFQFDFSDIGIFRSTSADPQCMFYGQRHVTSGGHHHAVGVFLGELFGEGSTNFPSRPVSVELCTSASFRDDRKRRIDTLGFRAITRAPFASSVVSRQHFCPAALPKRSFSLRSFPWLSTQTRIHRQISRANAFA